MSLSVEGQKCPVCQAYLFDEDDVVFCPVCGLAHHRDCYKSLGHCAMEHLHGTDEQYKKPEEQIEEPQAEATESDDKMPCRFCHAEIPKDSNFCPNCRAPVMQHAGVETNIPLDSEIDGVKVERIARFTMLNPVRYVKKFMSLGKDNRLSWNWAAFLFPTAWSLFRKNWKSGILIGLLEVSAALLQMPFTIASQEFVVEGQTRAEIANQFISILVDNIDKIGYLSVFLFLISLALILFIRIFVASNADYIYKERVISTIKEAEKLNEEERNEVYRKKGGVDVLLFALGYFATEFLPTLILNLALVLF